MEGGNKEKNGRKGSGYKREEKREQKRNVQENMK